MIYPRWTSLLELLPRLISEGLFKLVKLLNKVVLHRFLPFITVRHSSSFSLLCSAQTNSRHTASSTPFAISQPNNFYKSRYLETTLWSIKNCSASGLHTLSASWKSESQGAQDVMVCANADSKASVPGNVCLSINIWYFAIG